MTELSPARPATFRAPNVLLLLALLVPGACVVYLIAQRAGTGGISGLPLDDAWIHLVFARSLARGEGLAFNPGDIVPATTSPLWTALLSLALRLPLDAALVAKLLGVVLAALAVVESGKLAAALGLSRLLSHVAAAAVATTDWLAWSAISGMEIPLFVWLSVAGMRRHVEERATDGGGRTSLLLLALAALARPEGLLLLLLAFGERLTAGSGRTARVRALQAIGDLAVLCAVLIPPAAFNLVVSGSPLPTTFAAKAGGVSRALPQLHTLYLAFGLLFRSQPLLALLAGGGALELLARRATDSRRTLLPALWLVALPCALATLGTTGAPVFGNFGRYLFPLFPPLAVVGCAALDRPLAELCRPGRRLGVLAVASAVVAVLAPPVLALAGGSGRYARSVADVEASDVRLARWLAPRLPPEALVAVSDIGALKYFLPNRLFDLGALVTPDLHRQLVAEGDLAPQEALLRLLERRGVDYVAAFPRLLPAIEHDRDRFQPIVRLAIPDNITMAGDELVLYRTRWCSHPLRELPDPAAPDPTRSAIP